MNKDKGFIFIFPCNIYISQCKEWVENKKKSEVKSGGPIKSGDQGCSPFSPWVNPALGII